MKNESRFHVWFKTYVRLFTHDFRLETSPEYSQFHTIPVYMLPKNISGICCVETGVELN